MSFVAKAVGTAISGAGKIAKQGVKGVKFAEKVASETAKEAFEEARSKQKDAHEENMKEIDRFTTNIQKELIQKCQKQLGAQDITFTGNLRQHIEPGFEEEFKTVEANTPYAYFVEYGLPAGKWVNFNALHDWVEKKLGISTEPELTQVTWKVIRKINEKGIEPKRFMKKGIKALIARRGVIRTRVKSNIKRSKSSRLSKISKKVGRIVRTITKYVGKVDKVRKMGR